MASLGEQRYYQPVIGALPEAIESGDEPPDAELSRLWTVLYNYLTSVALATIYDGFSPATVTQTLAQIISSCASEQLLDRLIAERGAADAPSVLAKFVVDLALKKLQAAG